jgi:membrane-associated protein
MEFFSKLFHLLFGGLSDTARWNDLIGFIGTNNIYAVLFLIVFAETGLVVTPFLPGDSLLFAVGAVGARPEIGLNLPVITGLLIVAAIVGDAVNYWIGYRVGPAIFSKDTGRLLNKEHLIRAQRFYERYGGKTIILARFVPIVRTFAPFVAGVGRMNYLRFAAYNVLGGIAWVLICVVAGYFFGQFAFVQRHFELVILAIIAISVMPMAWEVWRARIAARNAAPADAPAGV